MSGSRPEGIQTAGEYGIQYPAFCTAYHGNIHADQIWSYVKKKYKLNMPFLVLSYPAKASALLSNTA